MISKNPNSEFEYYKKVYSKEILFSKPIICDENSEIELHILTCSLDLLSAMWSLKTFYHYSELRPKLVIHDDGSLSTSNNLKIFLKHFKNSNFIKRKDADINLKKYLKDYKFCSKFRFEGLLFSIRLFDYFYYSKSKEILNLDSDLLFFRKPFELINCIKEKKGFFMSDQQNSYSLSIGYLNDLLNIKMRDKINAGLFYFPKRKYYNLDLLESYLKKIYEKDHLKKSWTEQTAFAILFSKYKGEFIRLGSNYQISKQPITDKTISHHFVSDNYRDNFYKEGLKRLKLTKFLEKFNKT